MGRRKVPMKKIEDKPSRQVTFSKRRGGLMKKARELSILCDVEVAVIIVSANGRVYDFCSGNCLPKVLERYQAHVDAKDVFTRVADYESNHRDRAASPVHMTSKDLLHMVRRQFDEKSMNQLNVMELMQLAQNIDVTLGQTRFRKTQLLMKTITTLKEKEKQMKQERRFMEMVIEAKCRQDRQQHLREKDLVKELELNNDKFGGDECTEKQQQQHHQEEEEEPVQQVMFRLL